MEILTNTLIGIGFIIMMINTALVGYEFILKRDVWYGSSKGWKVFSIFVCILLFIITVGYVLTSFIEKKTILLGIILIINAILVFIMLEWGITTVNLVKERGKDISRLLMSFVDSSDKNLSGHSLHVHYLTMLLYDHLPFEKRLGINRENLEFASLFHDIGKVSGLNGVTEKGGKLLNSEWEEVKHHPELSVKAISRLPSFKRLSDWIMYHHERPDGNGYYGLSDKEIPLASKIISVCDVYSAITMDRSYKATLSYDEAITELKQVSGTQLDPEMVEVFLTIPKKDVESCKDKAMENIML